MAMELASRMERLGTETAFEVLARARQLEAQGRDVVHLEIGEPDFDTPSNIVDAGVKALRAGQTHYGPSAGLPEARARYAEAFGAARGLKVEAENVVVTPGAKPILYFVITALVGAGDEVLYPNPGFPIYESVVNFCGGKAVPLPLREESGFRIDHDELRKLANKKTKLIILNSPGNPTGGVLELEDLQAIADVAIENDCWILADEIYSRILYDTKHQSILALDGMRERTIVLDGHSKTWAMTGWRLGYGVMPTSLVPHIARLMTNVNSCTASFTQIAGIEALVGDQSGANTMLKEFRIRRDLLIEALNAIDGVRCASPGGAFYAFPSIQELGVPSEAFASRLLDDYGVAALAGDCFGIHGKGYLRFSYANSQEQLREGVARLATMVGDLGRAGA